MRYLTKMFCFASILVTVLALPAWAQVTTGTLSGTVMDNQGAVIQNAAVTIQLMGSERITTTQTDAVGRFYFPRLRVGNYTLTVNKEGYQIYKVEQLRINLGTNSRIVCTLPPVTEFEREIVILAERPLIDVTKSTQDTVLTSDVIDNVPTFERDFYELLVMLNQVQKNEHMLEYDDGLSIAGMRPQDNIFQVDGVDNNSFLDGQAAQFYSLDVLEEVQLSTAAYTAEYGRGSGGLVNIVTKSGTDRYSGRFSLYIRDDILDENEAANDWHYRDMSFVFGGPIKKKKLYFLLNYNRITRRDNRDYTLDHYMGPMDLEVNEWRDAYFTKINWYPRLSHEFIFNYNFEPFHSKNPLTNGFRPNRDGYTDVRGGHTFSFANNWTLSDNMHSALYFKYRKIDSDRTRNTPEDPPISYGYRVPYEGGGGGGIISYEGPYWTGKEAHERGLALTEKLSYFTGTHTYAFGGDINYMSMDTYEELSTKYQNRYTVLPPDIEWWYKRQLVGEPRYKYKQMWASAYAQDDWQISKKLTLNLGARVDHNSFLGNTVVSPRLGFAFDPIGDQKTVIRGGTGVYYSKNFFDTQRRVNAPDSLTSYWTGGEEGEWGEFREARYRRFLDPDIKTPFTWQMSIGVERILTGDLTFNVNAEYKKNEDQFYVVWFNLVDENTGKRPIDTINDDSMYGNQGHSTYRALVIGLNKRYNGRWMLRGDYTLSRAEGNASRYFGGSWGSILWKTQQNQDKWVNSIAPLSFDLTHQLKLTGVFRFPLDIMFSFHWYYQSGYPMHGADSYRDMPDLNAFRMPSTRKMNVRFQKSIRFGGQRKLHVYVDMLNFLQDKNDVYVDRYRLDNYGDPNPFFMVGYAYGYTQGTPGHYYGRMRETQIGVKFDF